MGVSRQGGGAGGSAEEQDQEEEKEEQEARGMSGSTRGGESTRLVPPLVVNIVVEGKGGEAEARGAAAARARAWYRPSWSTS